MRYYYTYKINLLCGSLKGSYYLGQHSTQKLNDGYVGSGKKLWNYYRKYGIEEGKTYTKDILSYYSSQEELDNAEKQLIGTLYNTDKLCINLKAGGKSGRRSEECQNRLNELYKLPDWKKKKSASAKQMYVDDPELRIRKSNDLVEEYKRGSERVRKIREKQQSAEYLSNLSRVHKKRYKDHPEYVTGRSIKQVEKWAEPEYRKAAMKTRHSDKYKTNLANGIRQMWQHRREVINTPNFKLWFLDKEGNYRSPLFAVGDYERMLSKKGTQLCAYVRPSLDQS